MLFISLDADIINLSTTQIACSLIRIVRENFPSGDFKIGKNIQQNTTFSTFQQQ